MLLASLVPGGERAETETESASCFRFAARFSSGNWRGFFGEGVLGWLGRWVGAGREMGGGRAW